MMKGWSLTRGLIELKKVDSDVALVVGGTIVIIGLLCFILLVVASR